MPSRGALGATAAPSLCGGRLSVRCWEVPRRKTPHEVCHIQFDHGENFDALWATWMMETSMVSLMCDPRIQALKARGFDA
jgi:hypothetical protein